MRRDKRGGRFVRYDSALMKSDAWLGLSGNATRLHMVLIERQFSSGDELASLSETDACKLCGFGSRNTARAAFKDLEERGFIALEVPASLGSNGFGRAAKWRLTHRPYAGKPPTRDWMKFKTPVQKLTNTA